MKFNLAALPSNILAKIIVPKGGSTSTAASPTYNSSAPDQILTKPVYREHIADLVSDRLADNSLKIMEKLFIADPDVSAAMNSYLTIADTDYYITATDVKGNLDSKGIETANTLLSLITTRLDYATGYDNKATFSELVEEMRYMVLLRGGISGEIVFGDSFVPVGFKQIDVSTLEWTEKTPTVLKPQQTINGVTTSLDIPSFFTAFHRKSPLTMYASSSFVSAINTIAARQQLINDLYRVMTITGFPRMDVTVVEEVLIANAPADVKSDAQKLKAYVRSTMAGIQSTLGNLRSDQAFVHTDSVVPKIINEKNPASGLDITHMINVLNSQNQAGLRAMGTVLGRGESGVNTASTEARLFSLNADQINKPIAALLTKVLNMLCRMYGVKSIIEFKFLPCELRPDLELEPQRVVKQSRLHKDLSLGLISDDHYHLSMYYAMKPKDAPELSGTGFMEKSKDSADTPTPSPNSDPLGRAVSPDGSKTADSNQVKK